MLFVSDRFSRYQIQEIFVFLFYMYVIMSPLASDVISIVNVILIIFIFKL